MTVLRGDLDALKLAQIARQKSREKGLREYTQNFAKGTSQYWEELALKYNVRLPMNWIPPSTNNIRKWLKKLGISQQEFYDWFKYQSLKEFAKLNPSWNMKSLVGLLLEYLESKPREIDSKV